ncbi:MAG: acyl-CoA dehydrogenase C-terminal domain-containing protein [Pseudomonadota bacterium]
MPQFKAPVDDVRFLLHEVLDAQQLTALPGYEEATPDLVDAILDEAAKLSENALFPLNQSGDQEGCTFENGVVRTPTGFKQAYDTFVAGGWTSLAGDPAYGGQGLPKLLEFVMTEMFSAANLSFSIYPGLSHGAYNALEAFGTETQKSIYLPKLIDGTWSGTMCLTEPHCGTDLGLIRTKAVPGEIDAATGERSYKLTGTKIFISAGEHDLTDNIVHLVLAKLPDAPEGVRGISLFVVPKFKPMAENGAWQAGPRNGIACGSIEHKMGIKASSTCVMNLDEAEGYLVGAPHKGMRAMFVMMNAARLVVGLQGLGVAEVSYQNALAYAKDRLQGRALSGAANPDKPADPIIVHPDVRKNLLTMKAFTEGARALTCWIGLAIDHQINNPDPKARQEADDLVQLMTPIIKASLTDMGYDAANLGMQVLGGHGYIQEWGLEQYVRDARITQIYEGANGIQALDLVGRKMPAHMGRYLRRFFHPVAEFLDQNRDDPAMAEFIRPLARAFEQLQMVTGLVAQRGLKDPVEAGAASSDYLRIFGLVALGYMWARMAKIAGEQLPQANGRAGFYDAKLKTARFFMKRILPQTAALALAVKGGAEPLMAMEVDQF